MRKILCAIIGLLFTIPSFANCNLLPVYNTSPVTVHGVTFTPQPDGSIIINGSVNDDSEYANYIVANSANNLVLPAGTYTISGITGGSSSTYILDLYGGYISGNATSDFFDTRTGDPIRRTATSEWRLGMYAIRIMRGYTANNLVVRPMIEQGSTATPYTPYDATCMERCKNLLDPNLLQQIGIQDDTGTNAGTMTHRVAMSEYIPVTPGQKYVFSSSNSNIIVHGSYFYDENKSFLLMSSTNQFNATVPENARYMRFSLQKPDNSELSVQDVINANPQLELGSTATAYVPYHPGCHETKIKIATTKYTETVFNPLNTALQNAISVVDSVVSRTIAQAASIATLQSGKQTRPANDTCPAYKQCLLVEDEQGVPHWYEITDPFRDFVAPIIANNVNAASSTSTQGYTQLEYIESTGTQYIDTGVAFSGTDLVTVKYSNITRESGSHMLFGYFSSNGKSATVSFYNMYPTGGTLFYDTSAWIEFATPPTDDGLSHVITMGQGKLSFDDVVAVEALSTDFQTSGHMYLFFAGNYLTKARIYSYQHKNTSGTLIRNMIPVRRNSDGAIGMYDTVTKTFFTNAGTGTFTAGPTVANTDVPANPTWTATWTANASNGISAGTVYGEGLCNGVSGTYATAATSSQLSNANWNTTGTGCWCKVSGLTVGGEYNVAPSSDLWVFSSPYDSTTECATHCAYRCATYVREHGTVRSVLLGM